MFGKSRTHGASEPTSTGSADYKETPCPGQRCRLCPANFILHRTRAARLWCKPQVRAHIARHARAQVQTNDTPSTMAIPIANDCSSVGLDISAVPITDGHMGKVIPCKQSGCHAEDSAGCPQCDCWGRPDWRAKCVCNTDRHRDKANIVLVQAKRHILSQTSTGQRHCSFHALKPRSRLQVPRRSRHCRRQRPIRFRQYMWWTHRSSGTL